MNTRDLGTHMVELHDQGTLDIIGSNVRLTLPAREVVELLRWLNEHKDMLEKAAPPGKDEDTKEVVTFCQKHRSPTPTIPAFEPAFQRLIFLPFCATCVTLYLCRDVLVR